MGSRPRSDVKVLFILSKTVICDAWHLAFVQYFLSLSTGESSIRQVTNLSNEKFNFQGEKELNRESHCGPYFPLAFCLSSDAKQSGFRLLIGKRSLQAILAQVQSIHDLIVIIQRRGRLGTRKHGGVSSFEVHPSPRILVKEIVMADIVE